MTLGETTQINDIIHDAVGDDAEIIFGAGTDPAMQGEVRVTVIATGFDRAVTGDTPSSRRSAGRAPACSTSPSGPQPQAPGWCSPSGPAEAGVSRRPPTCPTWRSPPSSARQMD